jgi:antitoxin component of RelBE/YafQ-DinJ toxin-antitoxin module
VKLSSGFGVIAKYTSLPFDEGRENEEYLEAVQNNDLVEIALG